MAVDVKTFSTFLEANLAVAEFEKNTKTKYAVNKVTRCFASQHDLRDKNYKITFQNVPGENYSIPFIQLGMRELECHRGKNRKYNRVKEGADIKRRKHKLHDTKKIGCKAKVQMKDILTFPGYKLKSKSEWHRRLTSKEIKEKIRSGNVFEIGTRQFIVFFPSMEDHNVNCTTMAAGISLPVDKRIIQHIRYLTTEGVRSVVDMQKRVQNFVERELFPGGDLPPRPDRRYYPSKNDIRNTIYRYTLKSKQNSFDQENLIEEILSWNKSRPEDQFFFRTSASDESKETDNTQEIIQTQNLSPQKIPNPNSNLDFTIEQLETLENMGLSNSEEVITIEVPTSQENITIQQESGQHSRSLLDLGCTETVQSHATSAQETVSFIFCSEENKFVENSTVIGEIPQIGAQESVSIQDLSSVTNDLNKRPRIQEGSLVTSSVSMDKNSNRNTSALKNISSLDHGEFDNSDIQNSQPTLDFSMENLPSVPQKLLFVHQTPEQRHLLSRYGNELCTLDAAHRTMKNSLPLYFVGVRTNFGYLTVASFINQEESQESLQDALEMLKTWNPDWKPGFFLTDCCKKEIHAIEEVFPGCPVYISDFHREQAWSRWMLNKDNGVEEQSEEILTCLRRIARATNETKFIDNVNSLKELDSWKCNLNLLTWFNSEWLSCYQRWALAFRKDGFLIHVNCSTGIEKQNLFFTNIRTYLQKCEGKPLSQLVKNLVEEFLPEQYNNYVEENLRCSTSYRKYGKNIPEYLHDRPLDFVSTCIDRIHKRDNIPGCYIEELPNMDTKTFAVSKSGLNPRKFLVCIGDEEKLPSCNCQEWTVSYTPCKHMFALFDQIDGISWESLSPLYRMSPFISIDQEVVQKLYDEKEAKKQENKKGSKLLLNKQELAEQCKETLKQLTSLTNIIQDPRKLLNMKNRLLTLKEDMEHVSGAIFNSSNTFKPGTTTSEKKSSTSKLEALLFPSKKRKNPFPDHAYLTDDLMKKRFGCDLSVVKGNTNSTNWIAKSLQVVSTQADPIQQSIPLGNPIAKDITTPQIIKPVTAHQVFPIGKPQIKDNTNTTDAITKPVTAHQVFPIGKPKIKDNTNTTDAITKTVTAHQVFPIGKPKVKDNTDRIIKPVTAQDFPVGKRTIASSPITKVVHLIPGIQVIPAGNPTAKGNPTTKNLPRQHALPVENELLKDKTNSIIGSNNVLHLVPLSKDKTNLSDKTSNVLHLVPTEQTVSLRSLLNKDNPNFLGHTDKVLHLVPAQEAVENQVTKDNRTDPTTIKVVQLLPVQQAVSSRSLPVQGNNDSNEETISFLCVIPP